MALSPLTRPPQFLATRVEMLDGQPQMTTLCAGYERGEWRQEDFVKHLFDHLLDFALSWSRLRDLGSTTAASMIEEAAKRVYATEKYGKRGEFGELILHAVLRCHFSSETAVSKLFYKTAGNDTVKGFDCVHVVEGDEDALELWVGEAKFYSDSTKAIRSAIDSLEELTETSRLKDEFVLIRGWVDENWPYADEFRALTEGKSLDEIFPILRIPVLITYDSQAVADHNDVCEEYLAALSQEVEAIFSTFNGAERLPADIFIHLILVPLESKQALQDALHERLREFQGATESAP